MAPMAIVGALIGSGVANAQPVGEVGSRAPTWRLGAFASATDQGYVDADDDVRGLPLIWFDGDRLFFHATEGGVHLLRNESVTLDALVSAGRMSLDPDDLGREALAARDIDRDALDERKRSYYAGLSGAWRSRLGVVSAQAQTDVSGNAEGEMYRLGYAYPWRLGRLVVTPGLRATWLSDSVTDYYYGLDSDESLSGSTRYVPGSAFLPGARLDLRYALTRSWMLYADATYVHYPDEIADSPLIEDDHATSLRLGVSYAF